VTLRLPPEELARRFSVETGAFQREREREKECARERQRERESERERERSLRADSVRRRVCSTRCPPHIAPLPSPVLCLSLYYKVCPCMCPRTFMCPHTQVCCKRRMSASTSCFASFFFYPPQKEHVFRRSLSDMQCGVFFKGVLHASPVGVHKPWAYRTDAELAVLAVACPELLLLMPS